MSLAKKLLIYIFISLCFIGFAYGALMKSVAGTNNDPFTFQNIIKVALAYIAGVFIIFIFEKAFRAYGKNDS